MHNGIKFNTYLQNDLWAEAMNTTTLLEKKLLTANRNLKPISTTVGYGKRSILSLMQNFGKVCITTYRDNTHFFKLNN